MIVARYASYVLALRGLEVRGRGRVEKQPAERYPKHPWALVD